MNATCTECRSVFRIDPAKVSAGGVRARCSVCGGVIAVPGGTAAVAPTPSPVTVGATAAPTPSSEVWTSTPTTPVVPPSIAVVAPPPAPAPMPTPPAAPPASSFAPPPPREASHAVAGKAPSPAAAPRPELVVPRPAEAPTAPRRPVNPYLSNDPSQKARRLARALVSDIVAYHPQKREEALRTGALKQLFRDEIRKSYEEYVEQVGRPIAESTTHFQDALNDVLAGGKKVF